jgi:DNA-directed RNA polymerase subunit RPC12/RpoP
MFIGKQKEKNFYTRTSKTGLEHTYVREKTVAIFACDNCGDKFSRDLKHMDSKRLSDNYFHCCPHCDSKRFAQRKGIERKKIWDMPASLDWPVSKY